MITNCTDCNGDLENGGLLDSSQFIIFIQKYARIDNFPKEKWKISSSEAKFSDIRRVEAYRCKNCNRIFQYAQDYILNPGNFDKKHTVLSLIKLIIAVIIASFLIAGIAGLISLI